MADSGKQRLLEQFREASEGEQRKGYGGDQIEDAALYTGRLASRGAEAFVRSRMEQLMTARREAGEPPLYDLPFDLTATTEPSVSAELPPTAPAELPPPESPALPELPPAVQEGAMVSAETTALAEPSAPLELPAPEPAAEPASMEPVEKPARRRPRPEPEIPLAETKEDAWTPAYRDAPETRPHDTASKTTTDKASDMPQESGEPPKVRTRDASPARKADRKDRTPAGRDSAPIGERQTVKEKGGDTSERQSQTTEPGRQKLIRERGREANTPPTETRILEANVPEVTPQPTTTHVSETHVPEHQSAYTHTNPLPKTGTEHPVPQTREQPPVRTREAEPQQAGPRQKEMPADRAGSSSERMVVRTRDAETQSNTAPAAPGQTFGQQSAGTAEQGKRKLIRERIQQTAVRQPDTVSNVGDTLAAHDGTTTESPVPPPQKPPEMRRVAAQTVEASEYHPAPANAGKPPQDAVSGRQNVIWERTEQCTIRQKNDGIGVSDSAATHVGETAEASTPNPPKTPKTNRVAAQTAEASEYYPAPSNAVTPPQNAVLGKQKAIRERAEQIAEKPVSTGRDSGPQIKSTPAPIGSETPPDAVHQDGIAIKTSETYARMETLSSVEETNRTAPQGSQKAVRERVESVRENPSPVTIRDSGEYAPQPVHENRTPVKTREVNVQREALTDMAEASRPTIQEKQKAIRERIDGRISSMAETSPKGKELHPQTKPASARPGPDTQTLAQKQERISVKTREAYAQRTPPGMLDFSRTAEQGKTASVRVQTESGQVPIKTKDACLQRQTPTNDTETAVPQTGSTAPKEAPKELRKTVRTRDGLIQRPEPSAEANPPQPDTPDGKLPAHGRSGHAVEISSPQTEPTPPAQEAPLSAGTDQRVPDIKTRSAYVQKEAAIPREQPDNAVEQGRQKFMREQKRKAELKRAAERRPKIREAQLPGEEAETASEEAKNLAIDRMRQTQTVRTKEAWLRQQGLDSPKERAVPELRGDRTTIYQTPGSLPPKSADGLPGTEAIPGGKSADGKRFLPTLPRGESGSIKARTPPTRFIREKGRSTGGAVGNAAGKTVRDAAAGGSKAIKTMRPVVVKEAGKAAGKTIKTMETASKKAVKTAGTASAQMMRNAKRAAQASAKAKAIKETAARAAKQGARTLKEAAQAVAAGAKAAAASLQSLIAGLSAGGGVVLVILIVICLIGLLVATPFGLFLSGQTGVGDDNIQAAVSRLTGEYNARLQEIQEDISHDELDMASNIVSAMTGNWKNVLAVYAVRVTTDDFSATEVVTMTDEKMEILRETFWDMNAISYWTTRRTEGSGEDAVTIVTLHIAPDTKDADDAAEEYRFNDRQKKLSEELLSPEYDELFDALLSGSHTLVPGNLDGVLIPGDISETRRQVIATGSQLIGQVHYFWGGKSLVLGWDSRWGTPTRVWAAGSPSTGTVRPFGLDCSGFVDWVFYNVSGGTYVIGHGGGASMQHRYCTTIPWSEAQPGDLAFYPGDSHVGIIVGYDEAGNVKIMHCASGSQNGVSVTNKQGFVYAAKPNWLE